jgi:transposase
MVLFIATLGGLLLMMGHHCRAESLFYYFRLEDQVPENHLLRLIDRHVNFEFIRAKLKDCYSDAGRPSIDPELLLRMLLIGYLYGVTSERKLVEELGMHLAWRWFTGLGFDQEIPHHSTFSKNRHGRFQESNLFQELFEEIVARCVEAGLVKGEHMSVDGSFIQANADHHSRVPREQLAEVAKVNHTVREYLVELKRENPVEPPVPQQEKVSTTDPDSTYATKGGPARLGYYDNYLVDNASCVIVGVQATPARLSQESAAARDMIERYRERYGYLPQTLAADTTYGNGELLQWLDERGIAPYIRVKENPNGPTDLYGIDKFTYVPEENCYICPEGKPLKYVGINPQPHSPLLFDGEALSRVFPEEPLHARQVSEPCHPHLRVSAAACPRPGQDTRVRDLATGSSESGSTLRRTEELHRTTPTKAAPDALRARAVLPGGHGAEPETAVAIPQR